MRRLPRAKLHASRVVRELLFVPRSDCRLHRAHYAHVIMDWLFEGKRLFVCVFLREHRERIRSLAHLAQALPQPAGLRLRQQSASCTHLSSE